MPFTVLLEILVAVIIVISLFLILLKISWYKSSALDKTILLELTPPSKTTKQPQSIEQLYVLMHQLGHKSRLNRNDRFSLEIVSTRHEGIRYVVRIPKDLEDNFKSQITSYMPDIKFKKIKEYIKPKTFSNFYLARYKLARHFAFPLASHDKLYMHDPIAYINSAMTRLDNDEIAVFQVVVSPIFSREANRIRNKLTLGMDASLDKKDRSLITKVVFFVISLPFKILKLLSDLIFHLITSSDYEDGLELKAIAKEFTRPKVIGSEYIMDKLSQPLFRTSVRFAVIADQKKLNFLARGISAALASYRLSGGQGFNRSKLDLFRLKDLYRYQFISRLNNFLLRTDSILSASEVASLYHFPYGDGSDTTENVIRSVSRTLSAPASIKKQADRNEFEVVLGMNNHHGSETPIGLTKDERERHVYIVGGTGNGKTTLLQYAIVQDIEAGRGVAVVDPHGDLAETILRYIPEERIKDVIYFNPRDLEHPLGLNLLELPEGLSEAELSLEKDFVTESIISIFRKTFSEDDTGGHRIEFVLRNTIHTAFTIPGATLFTLYDLLTDVTFRNKVTKELKDKRLKQFWDNEFGKAGGMQRVKMASGVTNKLGRYDRSEVVRRVMEQERSTIDFDNILASNKILICNFAKGSIGEDTATLFGITVLAKIQLAALRRARQEQATRTPFYLYVDEFQHFATHSFLQMLSEARKYKLLLTMAEQSTAQQVEQRLVHVILDNVGTVISFRVRSSSERIILPLFKPYLEMGDISGLPAYNFYIKITGKEAYEPMSGETIVLDEVSVDNSEKVKTNSIEFYQGTFKESLVDGQVTSKKEKQVSVMKKSLKHK